MPITVERVEDRKKIKGYEAFIAALETAYNLKDIDADNLKWVDIKPREFEQPRVCVHISDDHPNLSVILRPENEEDQIMREHERYTGPLLLAAVDRWGSSDLELKNYKIDRWRGRPGSETMFQQSRSLAEIIAMDHSEAIKDSTPVVEVVSLLPMAPKGEFQTQFVPYLSLDITGHHHYKVSVISENALSAFALLTQGQSRPVKDIDEKKAMYNWMGSSVPILSEMEQLMLPSSHGHMILIATPVEDTTPKFDMRGLGFASEYDLGGTMRGGPSTYGGGAMKGASIGGVSIGRGSRSGEGSIYGGEIRASRDGNPIIYHIKFLGVTPIQANALDKEAIGKIGASLNNYQRN